MALELAAFRLYAPYFGYSIYVWGGMIAVVMAAMAAGYAGGGWIGDRSRTDRPLYLTILCAAAYQGLIVLAARSLLGSLAGWGEVSGSLLATLLIFAAPVAALSAVGPFVTRLLARAGNVGATAGRVNAVSTFGSIAGVIATSFWIVPTFGTRAALLSCCAVTSAIAAAGLLRRRPAAAALALPPALLFLIAGPLWPDKPGTLLLDESAYNLVRVQRAGDDLLLLLNDGLGAQTIRNLMDGSRGNYYYADFALGPLMVPEARRVLVLGMGGGGSIAATRLTAPQAIVDAVEIDRSVVDAAARFFDVHPEPVGRLNLFVADVRPWLATHAGQYDIIHVDLYHGGPYVPFYLTTIEFYQAVRAHLSDDGVLIVNVFDPGHAREILNATAATLKRAFPTLLGFEHGRGTYVLFAFPRAHSPDEIRVALLDPHVPAVVRSAARRAASSLGPIDPPPGASVFTDDLAPIEQMTRRMLNEVRTHVPS